MDRTHQEFRDLVFNTAAKAHASVQNSCETYYRGTNHYHLKAMHTYAGESEFNYNHYRTADDSPITPVEVYEHLYAFYAQSQGKQFISSPEERDEIILKYAIYWADPSLQKSMTKTLEITRNLLFLEDNLAPHLIDDLCEQNQIIFKNIEALTCLRLNKSPLDINLFNKIAMLNDSDIPVTDTILEALCTSMLAQDLKSSPGKITPQSTKPSFFYSKFIKDEDSLAKTQFSKHMKM